jgi:hypothetical protein
MKVYEGLRDPDEPNAAGDAIVLVNGDPEKAERLHQHFKFRVVAGWPQGGGWKITGAEIDEVCAELEEEHNDD